VPATVWEDIPLNCWASWKRSRTKSSCASAPGALQARPNFASSAPANRSVGRPIKSAQAGYLPSVQLFGGYGWRSSAFLNDLAFDVAGWNAGAQLNWNLFDGLLTKGRVQEAEALYKKSLTENGDQTRRIELEVRTTYSTFIEAKEIFESQRKVVEQAKRPSGWRWPVRMPGRSPSSTCLNAQTSLTQARTTETQGAARLCRGQSPLRASHRRGQPRQTNEQRHTLIPAAVPVQLPSDRTCI